MKLADPLDRATVANVVVPSKKLTLPVTGTVTGPLFGVTVAVRVTGWQAEDGFGELVNVRVVVAVTTWLTVFEQIGGPSKG